MSDTNSPFTVVSNIDTPSVNVSGENTVLSQLKSVIQKKVQRPDVEVSVPERPGVSLRISPNITQHQLRSWRKNAGEDSKSGMDTVKFSCSVIGHTTTAILMNGEVVTDENGYELTFGSPAVLEMTNTSRPLPDAVKVFFGVEPHLEAAAVAIMEAAGYGDTVDTVDPTMKSTES